MRQSTPWYRSWWENAADYAPNRATPRAPLFPFGFGLSYCDVAPTALVLSTNSVSNASLNAPVGVNVTLVNRGGPGCLFVVQVYFNQTRVRVSRFTSMLLGFTKVAVPPAPATVNAQVTVPLLNLAAWNAGQANYTVDATTYGVWTAANSADAPTAATSASLTVTAAR